MTTAGDWCQRCHHYIVPDQDRRGGWVHYSDDDWSKSLLGAPGRQHLDSECQCARELLSCAPPRARVFADLAEGLAVLSRAARYATVSYTSLAAALELEKETNP